MNKYTTFVEGSNLSAWAGLSFARGDGTRWNAAWRLSGAIRYRFRDVQSLCESFEEVPGASPPYGVVKLRSEFLADFHVL